MKIGYENTDKKIEIEIYGLKFEIKNVEKLEEYKEIDDNDLESLKEILNILLGDDAVEKINKKRKEDGYKEIDNQVVLNIFMGIFKAYTSEYMNDIVDSYDKVERKLEGYNRRTRRNYNRSNRKYYDRY